MSDLTTSRYDVAIVGAGPAGSVCALAHAQGGAKVALLEANPNAAKRLAGEWLHPPALTILRKVGIDPESQLQSFEGKGFVIFPEDNSDSITLPYLSDGLGMTCEHEELVTQLHGAVRDQSNIDFICPARVRSVADESVTFSTEGVNQTIHADRIVGADGRNSIVRKSLGLLTKSTSCSRMIGAVLDGVSLPKVGFGHVLLGGPGPILMYHLNEDRVRIIIDVPLDLWIPRDRIGMLVDSYIDLLPESLRTDFEKVLRQGAFHYAANDIRQRLFYGTSKRVLIGDAAGHYHPMTAVGMTLAFGDAIALSEGRDFAEFKKQRVRASRAPEFLAMGLYEVFSDHRVESVALRRSIYSRWRNNAFARLRTVDLLACRDTSVVNLSFEFYLTVLRAVKNNFPCSLRKQDWRRVLNVIGELAIRLSWLVRGVIVQRTAGDANQERHKHALNLMARAFLVSMSSQTSQPSHELSKTSPTFDANEALTVAAARLVSFQGDDGSWEGEMTWCPMLTAQYVLLHHIVDQPLADVRKRRIVRYFEQSQLDEGVWGMHDHSPPSLFVTTLVYVAARLLGMERSDPLLTAALRFIQEEGTLGIPSWGKFWLAMLNLYDWRGLHVIIPELWRLPRRFALHPSNWYCHTRLIYMAMSVIYSHRFSLPVTPLIETLRDELYPQGYDTVDFASARNRLRNGDLFQRPGVWLRVGYAGARIFERFHSKRLRAQCVNDMLQRIKWELQTTNHTSISPVSGLLNILAVWLHEADDDYVQAMKKLDGWIWEDEDAGLRVTGARSASWDTGFALQALAAIPRRESVEQALQSGAEFLYQNQIRESFKGYREAFRADPKGGWCFAGGWHGWPVSDCTAEAVLGLLAAQGGSTAPSVVQDAVEFILRSQNKDGGFGSYEAKRTNTDLEWLNPSEMFGESMTEHSFVECTASCMAALGECRQHFPDIAGNEIADAIDKAGIWLRRTQTNHGSWRGVWGIQYIYGTMFGIRGLRAAGVKFTDPDLRLASQWLLSKQRDDGGWGEHYSGAMSGHYVAHDESQVIQTAWALIGLLESGSSQWNLISRGVEYLVGMQNADGSWPKQDMAGVFFRTALLDYALYRQYFPLHALGLYVQRSEYRHRFGDSETCIALRKQAGAPGCMKEAHSNGD
ncbi:MAG: FAD-dependent monooxygenase [Acidiferrobacterales bacterium]|nr:FAD-dependent monooxygenase [Acidiferrobacterales bacterium]